MSIWQNDYQGSNNFLKIALQGNAPNTQAIGARISVILDEVQYVREVRLGSNFASHNSTVQHFGLGGVGAVNSVVVDWPNGEQTQHSAIDINQTLIIRQSN